MERDEVIALLDNQRKNFKDALDRMEKMFARANEKHEKRISELVVSLEFTQAKLDEAMANMKQVSDEKASYEKRIGSLNKENEELRKQIQSYESRLDYLDDQSRRNNLRIVGIPEEVGENWEKCQVKVSKIIKEEVNISQANIERAHRVGKVTSQRCRDIIAKFAFYPERDAVFRARSKLKGTNIFINEDFCPGTVEVRRNQMDAMKEARRNGKQAFFNYRTLVVRDGNRTEGGGRYGQLGGGDLVPPSTPRTPPRPTACPRSDSAPEGTPTTLPAATTRSSSSSLTDTPSLTWSALAKGSPGGGDGGAGELGATALPQRYRDSSTEKRQLRDRSQVTQYKFK